MTEAWLRGPVDGFDATVMPVVHALIQVREDVRRLAMSVPAEHVWMRPGGAASIGFHIRHTAGALDRLFTYARGEALSAEQRAALRLEEEPGETPSGAAELADALDAAVERAFAQLRSHDPSRWLEPRLVGRAQLPSTTLGLLFHAAEHATRHAGQALTTARIISGGGVR